LTEKTTNKAFPAVILAAGLSERMGSMKPLLMFGGKQTFLDRIVQRFREYGSKEIIIVVNKEVQKKISKGFSEEMKIILNENPTTGRMDSLKLGIGALKDKTGCFIHNADNPFINPDMLEAMINKFEDGSYIVPVVNGKGGHPVLISSKIIKQITIDKVKHEDFRLILSGFKRINLETQDEKVLCNINTLEDFRRYFGKQ
jgi:molybdenum cofactor cytidylyltransferase